MNAFAIVIVLMAALALLALIFSFIAVRGKNGPWGCLLYTSDAADE